MERLDEPRLCNKGTASAGPQPQKNKRRALAPERSRAPLTRLCGVGLNYLLAAFFSLGIPGALLSAQDGLTSKPRQSLIKTEAVQFLYPEQVSISAGKESPVALHFRIRENLHINSHKPREQYLIPTVFSIPESSGVRLASASYPSGTDFTLPADPSEKLLVYTGEFTIDAKIVATPGDHLVEAKLRYQACDQNACMPPKTITVPIDVIGK